jgi:DNA repair protein RadB
MKFSAGCEVMDSLLEGGYPKGVVTTIYGPAASGKTTACMLAAIRVVRDGKKVLYVETEGGFSAERFKQLAPDYEKLLPKIIFLRIKSFEDQIRQMRMLPELAKNPAIGLVIVDTIGSHYRSARREENYRQSNNELAMQIDVLSDLARREGLLVLMADPVYADVEKIDEIVPVGGEIIRKRSGCMVELRILADSRRIATLMPAPGSTERKESVFEIVQEGFRKC